MTGGEVDAMKASVIVFPGSNCDRDVAVALEAATGRPPDMVWHGDSEVPASDLIVLPGGFSYGDYLRSGAMAAHSPVMREVVARAGGGTPVLGICNGFQVLTEAGLLPGVLMRNATLKFICKDVLLRVERDDTLFTRRYVKGEVVRFPIAHKDGSYFANDATLKRLEGEGRVAFRYCDVAGAITAHANPNGSAHNIAGIYNETGTVLGLMPHPERLADAALSGTDGAKMFLSLVETLH
jgi:phosphoribosylformylglycinamidine synthase